MIIIIYSHQDHLELAEALSHCLKYQPGIKRVVIKNQLNLAYYHQLHIFVDLHHFANVPQKQMPPRYIMYNYQQLPFGRRHKFEMVLDKAQRALAIWDYSQLNRQLIKKDFCLETIYVPFGYSETYKPSLDTNLIANLNQIYDVIFIGELSPRRKVILTQLTDLGLNVIAPFRIDGLAKMRLIRQGKILLNMHKRDSDGILEASRLVFYLANEAFVISERSSDQQLMTDFEKKIVFADTVECIPQLVKNYLSRPDDRLRFAKQANQWLINEYHYANMLPILKNI